MFYFCKMAITWTQVASAFQKDLAALYPKEEIQQLFLMLFEEYSGARALQYNMMQQDLLSAEVAHSMEDLLRQLQASKPIQQLLGKAHFYGQEFEVSTDTLIPRPETEELVHLILQDNKGKTGLRIIDIGTGTGCIPISLALHLPADYVAVELSNATIQVAKKNAIRHKVAIQFVEADILEWDLLFSSTTQFDVIVSNPPYITPKEKEAMHKNVLLYEPHLALFVEEEAPLLFYDYIADFALAHLSDSGTLYFEINQYLSLETADLLTKKGFHDVQIIKDMNGADRIIRAKRHNTITHRS